MAAMLAPIAVLLSSGAAPGPARNMAILRVAFMALFTASGLLFRHASAAGVKRGEGGEQVPPALFGADINIRKDDA